MNGTHWTDMQNVVAAHPALYSLSRRVEAAPSVQQHRQTEGDPTGPKIPQVRILLV